MSLVFKHEQFLKKGDLVSGNSYLVKDGRIALYLGRDETADKFAFYLLGSMLMKYNYDGIVPAHEDIQVPMLLEMSKRELKEFSNDDSLYLLKTMPQLYGKVATVFTIEETKAWADRFCLMTSTKLNLTLSDDRQRQKSIYTSAKDLVVGRLYYGGQSPWRNTFCFLGRRETGEFLWCFIGNDEVFKNNPDAYIRDVFYGEIDVTKTNKKVRPLTVFMDKKYEEGFTVQLKEETLAWLSECYETQYQRDTVGRNQKENISDSVDEQER